MFKSVLQWSQAPDLGQYHLTTFRKTVASATTAANDFVDYTYYAGNPPANFYASAPLEASHIDSIRGINIPNVDNQFIKSITVMSGAASATTTSSQNQRLLLADYLLYYPFIDTDAVGEQQDMIQGTVTLPDRSTGEGVMMMAVSQSASSTNGQFTVSYTNQSGESGRTTQNTYTKIVSGGGVLVTLGTAATTSSHAFIGLQNGDTGVRSIESVTFTAAGGGLMALVLVRPMYHFYSTQECRRTTSSNLESFGAATQFESVIHRSPIKIVQGSVLGIIGLGNAGSLASSSLVGILETVWR